MTELTTSELLLSTCVVDWWGKEENKDKDLVDFVIENCDVDSKDLREMVHTIYGVMGQVVNETCGLDLEEGRAWVQKKKKEEEEEEEKCSGCSTTEDIHQCNNCDIVLCIDCDENEMATYDDGHTYCDGCFDEMDEEEE